jgi:AcrR family transcriptional regulator
MQNDVLKAQPTSGGTSLASQQVERTLARRREAYADEIQRLVDASFALIRDSGQLEPRVGEIVKAAGLSNQAFYRHFRSKDELLLTVLDHGVGQLREYLAHRMEKAVTPLAKIRAFVEGVLEQALQPEAAQATRPFAGSRARLAELFPREVAASEQQLSALLAQAIEAAAASGDLPNAEPGPDAAVVYDLAMGWMQRKLCAGEVGSRAEAARLVRFALRGLGAPGDEA